jgi:hypothetical protein
MQDIPDKKKNVNAQAKSNTYNITQALVDMFPELKKAFDLWNNDDEAGFEAAVLNSSFYKNNSALVRERLTAKANQRGVYDDMLEKFVLATRERLVKTGVKVDDFTLRSIATKAFESGMDENQVDKLVLQSGKIGSFGGSILTGIEALKAYANDFGVSVGKNYWDAQSSKLFAGETTSEDIQKEIRDLAKSAFPAYSDYFDKGISLTAATSSTISMIARLMGVDPNTVTVDNNPIYRELIQYVNPQTGKPEILPDYIKERKIKADKRSGYFEGPEGQGVMNSLMATSLSDMGLV